MIKAALFLKEAYGWAKENWILLGIIGAVVFMTVRHYTFVDSYKNLSKHFNEQSSQFHKQLADIEKANETWRIANEKLNMQYKKELELIKKDYEEKINNIEVKRIIIQTQIIKEAKADPTTLTKKLTETFGIPVSK